MENLFKTIEKNVEQLVQKYVRELLRIWERIFDEEACVKNMNKLIDYTKTVFEELLVESANKEERIEKSIQNLTSEIEKLQMILGVKLNLDLSSNDPLMTLQMKLDAKAVELRESARIRKEEVFKLLNECEGLCNELGEERRSLPLNILPTREEVDDFKRYILHLQSEKATRLQKLLPLREELKSLFKMLDITVVSKHEEYLLNSNKIKLDNETFNELHEMLKQYKKRATDLEESINKIKMKLTALWKRLGIRRGISDDIFHKAGYNQTTYVALHKEFLRCEALNKKQVKNELKSAWEEFTELSEKSMQPLDKNLICCSDSYDEQLATVERELQDLKSFYTNNEEIFKLYEERRILWNRMATLEGTGSEPGRYKNRGGLLLKEEKERKIIAKKLPKIEEKLRELVNLYEGRENKKFLVNGEDILTAIARDWEQKQSEKKKVVPVKKSPKFQPMIRQPMSARTDVKSTSTLHSMSSSISVLPSKLHTSVQHMKPLEPDSVTPSNTKRTHKPFLKKYRVIGSTIYRDSTKRLSMNHRKRSSQGGKKIPKIIISDFSNIIDAKNQKNDKKHFSSDAIPICSVPATDLYRKKKLGNGTQFP